MLHSTDVKIRYSLTNSYNNSRKCRWVIPILPQLCNEHNVPFQETFISHYVTEMLTLPFHQSKIKFFFSLNSDISVSKIVSIVYDNCKGLFIIYVQSFGGEGGSPKADKPYSKWPKIVLRNVWTAPNS